MKIRTKFFGEVEFEEREVIQFPHGLFGFESETRFLLIPFDSAHYCLQSAATESLAFIAMDPFRLDPGYTPLLEPEELAELNVGGSEELYYYVLCAVKRPVSSSTVNMKCPIAINGDEGRAMQVILSEGDYTMRCPLSRFAGDGQEGG